MNFVFDRYLENSIMTQTPEGKGIHISVRRDTSFLGDFKKFMKDNNKVVLFLVIANSVSQIRDAPRSTIATVN